MEHFLQNKYSRIYFSIIDNAKNRVSEGYKETHHIIPRCMGGSDDSNNLVDLTAREHYICHLLLPHMVKDNAIKSKLFYAIGMMVRGNSHGRIYSSWEYARARRDHGRGNTLRQTGKKMNLTEAERQRRAESLREARTKRSYNPLTDEIKKRISQGRTGQTAHNKGKTATIHYCPHCKKNIAGDGNFSRWHGDNCKLKSNTTRLELSSKLKGRSKPKYQCPTCNRLIGGRSNYDRHQSICNSVTS